MSIYGVMTPDFVEVRSEKTGFVADVKGGEAMVDAHVTLAANTKAAEKLWDAGKLPFRDLAGQVRLITLKQGKPITRVNFLGTTNQTMEVAFSSKRKELDKSLVALAAESDLKDLVVEETELVLKGELVKWAVEALGDRTGKDPRFALKRRFVLGPKYDEAAQQIRAEGSDGAVALITTLEDGGIYAPAVEARIKTVKE